MISEYFVIADFGLHILSDHYLLNSNDYLIKKKAPFDIEISTTGFVFPKGAECDIRQYESMLIHRSFAEQIPKMNSFVFHGVAFDISGTGIVFSAKSGTGKTTHLLNWKKLLGDKLSVINGDKPVIRFFDNEPNIPYAYGTPWNGKERFGINGRTAIKHICFIERSDTNFVTKIDKAQAVERIMKQVYMPKDPVALSKTLELVNRLINSCELWIIHCNMEPESAQKAYNAIFG